MPERKKVIQLDYYTGDIIETYESISSAADDNFVTRDFLSKCLNHGDGKLNNKKLWFRFKD